jgi:uncharacterized membrane protein
MLTFLIGDNKVLMFIWEKQRQGMIKMIKNILFSVSSALLLILFIGSTAFANGHNSQSIDQIIAEIREAQGIGPNEPIDPKRVRDAQLEELGEAVMDLMHPDEREHEFMDRMMGGEGSENLKYMHRMMGYRYLSGDFRRHIAPAMGWGTGGFGSGMMGSMPMMGWGIHGRRGIGGYGGFAGTMRGGAWSFFIGRIVMWIVILGIIGVVIWLIVRTQKQSRTSGASQGESPLGIAKRRYAKGEISREEFENLKRDLQ